MFSLPQKVTFWTVLAKTATGGKTYDTPVTIAARIAHIDTMIMTPEGKQHNASKAIYTKIPVPVGAYVVEGTLIDASPSTGAQLVVKVANNISMTDMNKAMV